jgi:hypothetical protein
MTAVARDIVFGRGVGSESGALFHDAMMNLHGGAVEPVTCVPRCGEEVHEGLFEDIGVRANLLVKMYG